MHMAGTPKANGGLLHQHSGSAGGAIMVPQLSPMMQQQLIPDQVTTRKVISIHLEKQKLSYRQSRTRFLYVVFRYQFPS